MEDVMHEENEEIDEQKTEEDNKNDHEEEDYEEKDITPEKNDKENKTKHKKEPESLEHKENDDYTMMLEDIENDDNNYDVESIIDDINIKKVNQEKKEKVDKETEKSYIKETNFENQTKLQNSKVRKGILSCYSYFKKPCIYRDSQQKINLVLCFTFFVLSFSSFS